MCITYSYSLVIIYLIISIRKLRSKNSHGLAMKLRLKDKFFTTKMTIIIFSYTVMNASKISAKFLMSDKADIRYLTGNCSVHH